jgi:hypothetical protein
MLFLVLILLFLSRNVCVAGRYVSYHFNQIKISATSSCLLSLYVDNVYTIENVTQSAIFYLSHQQRWLWFIMLVWVWEKGVGKHIKKVIEMYIYGYLCVVCVASVWSCILTRFFFMKISFGKQLSGIFLFYATKIN